MTTQEAINYIEQHANIDDVVKDMCIEALEKNFKLEEVVARLEEMKLIRVEQCHDDYEIEVMTESNFDDAIEIVKEGMG